jgi:hypothetical protein
MHQAACKTTLRCDTTIVQDEGTNLWTLTREERRVTCRVRLVPYGIEIDLLRDGALIVTRAFETDQEALSWADKKRAEREEEGWKSA